jgi:hypothetical protein
MRKEEGNTGQEDEEEEVSSYWITLNKQRRRCLLKVESTRLQSVENSIWKRPSLCRKTDFARKQRTCVLLSILVLYSSSRVSQEQSVLRAE